VDEVDEVDQDFADGATPLDRERSEPLWAQLEHELRRRLDQGDFDERFPTDRELIEIYGVSRHTARHAVARLGADGLVHRARGVGTSVDRGRFVQLLGSVYSLFDLVERSGAVQHSRVLALDLRTDAEAAAELELPPEAPLVHLARLRLADEEPLAVDLVWLPATIASPLLEVDFGRTSLYEELERVHGRRPNHGWERICPAIGDADERQLLEAPDGQALFRLLRLGMIDTTPVERRITTIRGDRFSFVSDWSAGQRSGLRLMATEV
jgi:GntR family transcriptional regulator